MIYIKECSFNGFKYWESRKPWILSELTLNRVFAEPLIWNCPFVRTIVCFFSNFLQKEVTKLYESFSLSVWQICQYNLFNQSTKSTDKVKHVLHVRIEIGIICHRANIANCSLIVWSTITVFILLTRIIITVGALECLNYCHHSTLRMIRLKIFYFLRMKIRYSWRITISFRR